MIQLNVLANNTWQIWLGLQTFTELPFYAYNLFNQLQGYIYSVWNKIMRCVAIVCLMFNYQLHGYSLLNVVLSAAWL